MLRLIHEQTVQGAILVDDIDDGLPNKNVKRLGSTADPQAYERDGYANKPKQPCYIPRVKPTDSTVAGYIDLEETQRVLHSSHSGKIKGLETAGLISTVSLVAADLVAPDVTATTLHDPATGDLTVDGTGFLSVAPDITSVRLFGAGVGDVTLTEAEIEAVAPGAVSDTEIIIDTTLTTGLQGGDKIVVTADGQSTDTIYLAPEITAAEIDLPATGDLTVDGVGFLSDAPSVTSVRAFGGGVGDVTLTAAQIIAVPPGAVSDIQIIIDTTLLPGLVAGDEVEVTADGVTSEAFTIVT